jgi:hypothetical protein
MACVEGIGGGPVRHSACSWARLSVVYRLRFNGSSKNGFGPDPMRDWAKAMPDPAEREGGRKQGILPFAESGAVSSRTAPPVKAAIELLHVL